MKNAVLSVLHQSDPDFEFLIAANACDDALVSTLESLIASDSRVSLYRTSIGQLAFNLNFLADKAVGDYLVRMDGDDLCELNRIAVLREALQQEPVDILGSWVLVVDASGSVLREMRLPCKHSAIVRRLVLGTAVCHPAAIIRRQFLLKMRGYSGGVLTEDTDLWLRSALGGGRFANVPQFLFRYRLHAEQASGTRSAYAEVVALWLRELLKQPSLYLVLGFLVACAKWASSPFMLLLRGRPKR
ncbi:MAG: glycosyltransferase [Rhodoferax sp.]|nr:glycosyltransferase [Rhodoferax sp.]